VWLPVALVSFALAGSMVRQVLIPRPFYTGTNSVGVRSVVVGVEPGQTLCVPDLHLPAETGRIQMAVFAHRPSFAARLTVKTAGRSYSSRMTGLPPPSSLDYANAPIPETPSAPSSVPATVCISPLDGPIALGGMLALQANQVPALLNGSPVANRVGVWFMPPAGTERSLLSQAGTIFRRAALFRAGGVGAWTYPVLLFLLLPFTWALSACLLIGAVSDRARLPRWFRSRAGWVLAVVAFANFGAWALITPAFNTPDEAAHFAYAQYFAETGHGAERAPGARPNFSTNEVEALNAINVDSQAELTDARPPWLGLEQRAWERFRPSAASGGNGGGYTVAASSHTPAYYATLAPAYLVSRSGSTFTQLTVMRLVSALMGMVVVLCAFGVMRELLPGRPLAAVAAGLLVAYHPMFGFISGAVNNDNGVNAGAALTLYLLVRGLRRGLTVPLALALGAAVVATPAMKETGYEIYPIAIVGLIGMIWRRHRLRDLAPYGTLIGTFLLARFGWKALQPLFYPTVSGHSGVNQGIVATEVVSLAEKMPGRFLVYLWELFLPQLSFMGRLFPPGWPFREVYVVRGWAAFGWYAWIFPNWVYTVIVYAMGAAALLAIAAAIRHWQALRRRLFEVLVILMLPVCVLVAVEAAFFAPNGGGRTAYAEQGRYIFPAIAALAVIAVGATFGVSRRWRAPLAVTMVIAMVALSYASQMLTLASAFT
jgi:4-amino-4-deoxy-L-arabinose transferase-like glycosyltransferase